MKKIKKPEIHKNNERRAYTLRSAIIDGYEYTKTYYKMQDGKSVKCDKGDDSDLTIISIKKQGQKEKGNKSFIFSEGYIGAERSYNEDGTKRRSVAKKDGFGVSYLIKYIENQEKNVDNFHVMFLSNKETSENQAELFAQAIKDVSGENIETTYMWCHSKSGLLALRAFEKLKDGDEKEVLSKIKAVITSMPTKGLDSVDRNAVAQKINSNKFLNLLPFSGFIKTGLLSYYDSFLYKPTPAQVDLKKHDSQQSMIVTKEKSRARKIFDKLWGNTAFEEKVLKDDKKVKYDKGYLERVTNDENLEKISDVSYKVLPVNIELKDALSALIKHAQIMPFILYAKKALSRQKGDGIVTYDEQGIEDVKAKFKKDIEVKAGHDIPTSPDALKTIKEELIVIDEER